MATIKQYTTAGGETIGVQPANVQNIRLDSPTTTLIVYTDCDSSGTPRTDKVNKAFATVLTELSF